MAAAHADARLLHGLDAVVERHEVLDDAAYGRLKVSFAGVSGQPANPSSGLNWARSGDWPPRQYDILSTKLRYCFSTSTISNFDRSWRLR